MEHDPKTDQAPHDCPNCGEPAYLGFGVPARCSNRECVFFCQELWADHVMALPDEDTEPGQYLDIEDEDTQPFLKMPSLSDLCAPPKSLGGYKQHFTPEQQKALDILDAAIDKIPVPYFNKPLDND